MTYRWPWIRSGLIASGAVAIGYVAWRFVPLALWKPALPSLLTALSFMGGAVLVRLARNAPITSPSTFNDEDLDRFFDTLDQLSSRLLWIFLQTMFAMILIISSVVLESLVVKPGSILLYIEKSVSAVLAFLLIWLVWKLYLMAKGDLGFLRLQRLILENAVKREKKKSIERIMDQSTLHRSTGDYGRALERDSSV